MIVTVQLIKKWVPAQIINEPSRSGIISSHWAYFAGNGAWSADPMQGERYVGPWHANNALEQIQQPGTVYVIETILVAE